ncbi:MAG: selenide, water dikinase SelD, partial [Chitinophagales bacterium]|nr:selenide, water dikinase SelD [Chitinophagales bacterium]
MITKEMPKLTQYSKASGCGCKADPNALHEILKGLREQCILFPSLLRDASSADDAAVYKLNDDTALLLTTDFFAPAIDNPYDFGRVAAANALSDIYAMGGKPFLALAVMAWPLEKIGAESARETLKGGAQVCEKAGVALAGGHTIEGAEPLFGLCVAGTSPLAHLKTNGGAKHGDILYLTKPVGSGILMSAYRRRLLTSNSEYAYLIDHLTRLNSAGAFFGEFSYVHALTDVTGFGLIGHLLEMCKASQLCAHLNFESIPLMHGVENFITQFVYPDITFRNWKFVEQH